MKAAIGGILALVFAIVVTTILGGSWYTVDQGERGVILRAGKIVGTADPGFGFKWPLIDEVVRISTQTRTKVYDFSAYSRDQQPADLQFSVTYEMPATEVERIYAEFGGEEGLVNRLIDRQANEIIRTVFGQYNAVAAVQDRAQMAEDMRAAVRAAVVAQNGPVIIRNVQMESVDFSRAYEDSIEQRMLAEVEVERIRQNAERERIQAEIVVIQAEAAAEARVEQATAEAAAVRMQGEAEAHAIRERGRALRDNPQLVALVTAERWNGILPTTMIPGSTVPFLNTNGDR